MQSAGYWGGLPPTTEFKGDCIDFTGNYGEWKDRGTRVILILRYQKNWMSMYSRIPRLAMYAPEIPYLEASSPSLAIRTAHLLLARNDALVLPHAVPYLSALSRQAIDQSSLSIIHLR